MKCLAICLIFVACALPAYASTVRKEKIKEYINRFEKFAKDNNNVVGLSDKNLKKWIEKTIAKPTKYGVYLTFFGLLLNMQDNLIPIENEIDGSEPIEFYDHEDDQFKRVFPHMMSEYKKKSNEASIKLLFTVYKNDILRNLDWDPILKSYADLILKNAYKPLIISETLSILTLAFGACVLVASAAPKKDRLKTFENYVLEFSDKLELSNEETAAFIKNAYNATNYVTASALDDILELSEKLDEEFGDDDSAQPIIFYSYSNQRFERVEPGGNEYTVPKGWPLTLGKHGVVLRLGELEASSLRLGECYLCVRSPAAASSERKVKAADSAAEAANTATTAISSSSSTAALTSNKAATDRTVAATAVDPSNTVEIALVWRAAASSMRAPGMLGGWEDEYAEWRESSSSAAAPAKLPPPPPLVVNEQTSRCWQAEHHNRWSSSSAASTATSANSIGSGSSSSHHHQQQQQQRHYRSRHESRSTERHCNYSSYAPRTSDVVLSSSSSVDAWAEEARAARQRRSTSSSRCGNDARDTADLFSYSTNSFDKKNKLKRGTRVVSPAAMEKWKETSRCETRSRVLAPQDLATPGSLESAAATTSSSPEQQQQQQPVNSFQDRQLNGDHANNLANICPPDEVADHELPSYIGKLLVQVERKIERVSVDDLTFPCLACRNIDTDDPLLGCKCEGCECDQDAEAACECSHNGNGIDGASNKEEPRSSFEVAGIKHIDSDDEEEVRMGFGKFSNMSMEIARASVF
ncbi:hypothetical protein TKK_0009359 [Trichogramma kaykai]